MVFKIILAVLITVIILFTLLNSESILGDILQKAKDKISRYLPNSWQTTNSKITFSVELNTYDYENLSTTVNNVNFSVQSDNLFIKVNGVAVQTEKPISIYGYSGVFGLKDNKLILDGSFEHIEIGDVTFSSRGRIEKTTTDFDKLNISSILFENFKIENGIGVVNVNNLSIQIKGEEVSLQKPSGSFYFSEKLLIKGVCGKISIGKLTYS